MIEPFEPHAATLTYPAWTRALRMCVDRINSQGAHSYARRKTIANE